MNQSPFSPSSIKVIPDKDIVDCLEVVLLKNGTVDKFITRCSVEGKWAYYDSRNAPTHKGWTYSAIDSFRGCISELALIS